MSTINVTVKHTNQSLNMFINGKLSGGIIGPLADTAYDRLKTKAARKAIKINRIKFQHT